MLLKYERGVKMIYGYARVSTQKQSIERQIRNIVAAYPTATIYQEQYTGTKLEGRKKFNALLKVVKPGDTIVFDSVSRMSRNATEGFELYKSLFEKGVELVFLKENYINTETYKNALSNHIEMTNTPVDSILKGVNEYLLTLAESQIKIAFDQAEKEVADLQQRTKEGIETARANGKQIGNKKGVKLHSKKAEQRKKDIIKYSKDFEGTLSDPEVIKIIGVHRNTYYKYKRELKEEY